MEKLKPYLGEEPYIFISYAHKDSEEVFHILEMMQRERYRFWFDEGIDSGSNWDQSIAEKIAKCDRFVAFLSEKYSDSENCKDEIHCAVSRDKKIIPIHLEPIDLNFSLPMRLSRIQYLPYYSNDPDSFRKKLVRDLGSETREPISQVPKSQILLHDITIRYPDGDVYRGEGLFESGEIEPFGYGTYTHTNGDVYEGENEYGIPIFGKMTYVNGDVYEGDWGPCDDGSIKWDGNGSLSYANGDVYNGSWSEGKQCGIGTLSAFNKEDSCGYLYHGNWLDGKMHGHGKMYRIFGDFDHPRHELFLEGTWDKGEFVG